MFMIHALLLKCELQDLLMHQDYLRFIIEHGITNPYPGELPVSSRSAINDLYSLINADQTELTLVGESEKYDVWGPVNQFVGSIRSMQDDTMNQVVNNWVETSFPDSVNSFDIYGHLMEIKAYIDSQSDQSGDYYFCIDKQQS